MKESNISKLNSKKRYYVEKCFVFILLFLVVGFKSMAQWGTLVVPEDTSIKYFGAEISSNGDFLASSVGGNLIQIYKIQGNKLKLDTTIVTEEFGYWPTKEFYIDNDFLICKGTQSNVLPGISFYRRNNPKWELQDKYYFNPTSKWFEEMTCMSISGDHLFMGYRYDSPIGDFTMNDSNKVFIFKETENKWTLINHKTNYLPFVYGNTIISSDSSLIIGSNLYTYFYNLQNDFWQLSDSMETCSVQMSVSKKYFAFTSIGKIHVFRKNRDKWVPDSEITNDPIDNFGSIIVMNDSILATVGYFNSENQVKYGVIIYKNENGNWLRKIEIPRSVYSLSLNKNILFVGGVNDVEITGPRSSITVYNMDSIPQHLTSLDTSPQYESIRIFMNSNSNEISLSNNSSVAVQIKIFDIMGRFIQEYSLAAFEEKKISFNNQNAGIYLIQYNSMYCSGSKKVLKVR